MRSGYILHPTPPRLQWLARSRIWAPATCPKYGENGHGSLTAGTLLHLAVARHFTIAPVVPQLRFLNAIVSKSKARFHPPG